MSGIEITRRELTLARLRAATGKIRVAKAARRMLVLVLVLKGVDRTRAAESCGMDRQTLRGEKGRNTVRGTVFPANARIGQQGALTRIRARRGTRPRDTRYQWACLFGAVCPRAALRRGWSCPSSAQQR